MGNLRVLGLNGKNISFLQLWGGYDMVMQILVFAEAAYQENCLIIHPTNISRCTGLNDANNLDIDDGRCTCN